MPDAPSTSSVGSAAATRCLLWLHHGCDAPVDLLEALRSRDVGVREVAHAPAVMAELALQDYAALVMVNAEGSREADRLIASVEKYHPSVSVRRYSPGSPQRLQRFERTREPVEPAPAVSEEPDVIETDQTEEEPVPETVLNMPAPPSVEESPPAGVGPSLEASKDDEPAPDEDDDFEPPLLTEEELAMLLGDYDADDEESTPS